MAFPEPTFILPSSTAGYEWQVAGPETAAAVYELFRASQSESTPGPLRTLYEVHKELVEHESQAVLVTAHGGRPVAFGLVHPLVTGRTRQAELRLEVHPHHRRSGIGEAVLGWLVDRGNQVTAVSAGYGLPRILRASCPTDLTDTVSLFERFGFRRMRHWDIMQRTLRNPLPRLAGVPGVVFERWSVDREHETKHVYDESFSEHWGYAPASFEDWRRRHTGDPAFRPDLSTVASHPEGLIGFSLAYVDREGNAALARRDGWIGQVGVQSDHRRRGIGRELLVHTLQALREEGLETALLEVDVDNQNRAARMYLRIGFEPIRRTISFVREL